MAALIHRACPKHARRYSNHRTWIITLNDEEESETHGGYLA